MGCSNTKEATQGTLLEQYHTAGLVQPWSGEYENEFEKQIFMAINLCRHDPKRFVPHVRSVYKNHVLLSGGVAKRMNDLIAKLQSTQTLPQVRFDGQANDACRQNNAAMVAKNEAVPARGGNIAKYSEITGDDKTSSCKEYTMVKFEGTTGEEFVALQLALDFEDFGAAKAKTDDKAAASQESAAAEKKPEVAGDKSTGEESKVAPTSSEVVPPTSSGVAAKKATPVIVGYSPILDETIEMVGISNKGHQKAVNIIQVLYCKTSTNAMM